MADQEMHVLAGQQCPMCNKKALTLTESETEVPFFGKVFLFSMTCDECKYHKADIECAQNQEPCKWTFDIENEKDLNVRIVKSAEATVKIPHMMSIESGPGSNGYVTNIEGILNRVKKVLETTRDQEEDNDAKKKAKNMIKKIQKVLWGQEKLKLIIEDPTGNSSIISERAVKAKLKTK